MTDGSAPVVHVMTKQPAWYKADMTNSNFPLSLVRRPASANIKSAAKAQHMTRHGMACRLEGPDEGTVSLQLYSAVMPGQQVVLHTSYVGSLAMGLTRSAAFDYIEASTGAVHSQVTLGHSISWNTARAQHSTA